jgi:thiol-disulfide isomerase/thioredoxin
MKKSYAMRSVLMSVILGTICLVQLGCSEQEPAAPATTADQPELAPETVTSHAPENLQVVDLADIKNLIAETAASDRVLVIDFWATWCVPCVEMFPALHAGLVSHGDRVRAVSVTLDDPSREAAAIEFLADQHALKDAYIFKSDSIAQQALIDGLGQRWNNLAVPAILVYDPAEGLVGEFLEGGATAAILELVNTLLASDQEAQP